MPSSSDYLLVPGDVGTTSAGMWVGTTVHPPPDPARLSLEHVESGARLPLGAWKTWSVPGQPARCIRHQRVTLTGLERDVRYRLALRVDSAVRASAEVMTLPASLPPFTKPPLTLLLGSCFSRMQDESGRTGRAYAQLPDGAKPRIKLLVGDQVYLDSPWFRFPIPHSVGALGRGFLDQYIGTWGQAADRQGFNHLLRNGANYFCADDHEFWNNAPFPSSFAVNTWTQEGRESWWRMASGLYAAFQAERSATRVDIPGFSMLVLDTRVNRSAARSDFLSAGDFGTFRDWVAALTSPGILVVGQPIFAMRAGAMGRFTDWNLPDFAQYAAFCRVLLSSRQSILAVTGDVHYGRIARATLASGAELIELISSPMALVDRAAGGSWKKAPDRFPADPIAGIRSLPVTTASTWEIFANHFVTLELNEFGGGLRVRVRAWETEPASGVGARALVADLPLPRVA